jgi:hypothetical protein
MQLSAEYTSFIKADSETIDLLVSLHASIESSRPCSGPQGSQQPCNHSLIALGWKQGTPASLGSLSQCSHLSCVCWRQCLESVWRPHFQIRGLSLCRIHLHLEDEHYVSKSILCAGCSFVDYASRSRRHCHFWGLCFLQSETAAADSFQEGQTCLVPPDSLNWFLHP